MKTLSQVIAVEADVKKHAEEAMQTTLSTFGKPTKLSGLQRTYVAKTDEDEQLPPETTEVEVSANEVLDALAEDLTKLFDHTATKDQANMAAVADVELNGQKLLENVPAVTLLFLEKQMSAMEKVIRSIPLLDPAERWQVDSATGRWVTPEIKQNRTKKIPKAHVLYDATKEHPAQIQTYSEDVVAGEWTTIKSSGAMPKPVQQKMLRRLRELQTAVKSAREAANTVEADNVQIGQTLLDYLLKD